jgi:hypothetical protein
MRRAVEQDLAKLEALAGPAPGRGNMDGLQRMLDFTNYLQEKRMTYHFRQVSFDEIMVGFSMPGERVEVYFTTEDVTYSVFTGNEDMLEGVEAVKAMVDNFRGG